MGLIAAALGAGSNVLSNQWKEYFYMDAIPNDTLIVAGKHKVTGRSTNTKGEENVITNGSKIVVADGQCMIIVEQGKIVEVCAEPGEFTFDTTKAPSIFAGSLGQSIKDSFKQFAENFTYGGMTAVTQKIYYVNTKLIMDQKFGTPQPIYFRVVDSRLNYDTDMGLRLHGSYSFQIADPILFYTNVAGNVADVYKISQIEAQLKNEFVDALQDGICSINLSDIVGFEKQFFFHFIPLLFCDDLAAAGDGESDCDDDDHALDGVLVVGTDTDDRQEVEQFHIDQDPDHGLEHSAFAAAEGSPTDDQRRDAGEHLVFAQGDLTEF